jgi:hypothetical protein
MQSIWHDLRDKEVVDAIALDRARRLGFEDVFERMREDIGKRADAAVALIGKYMEGGPRNNVLETLRALRHERLAHRQLSPATAPGASKRDGRRDRRVLSGQFKASKLSHILQSLVKAMAYDPEDTARVFRHCATCFWAGFQKNEKTRTPEA